MQPQGVSRPGPGERLACRVCRGPVTVPGFARCYQCDLHLRQAGSLLADAVMPVAYAVKGGPLASDLWRYKAGDAAAADRVRARLRDFLRDHSDCAWRAAGMATPPTRVAVVPSGQGRPGAHPLAAIAGELVGLPLVRLSPGPNAVARGREIGIGLLRVIDVVAGENVLLIDDTWVSGGSAQSAAVALKRAGADKVAVVVAGRHVDPADRRAGALAASAAVAPGHACLRGETAAVERGPHRAVP